MIIGIVGTSPTTNTILDLDYLTTRVAKLLRRSDIDSEIKEWLNFAQREAVDEINFPVLRTTTTIALVIDQEAYTLPTDFAKGDRAYYLDTSATPTWGRQIELLPRKAYQRHDIERLVNNSDPTSGDPLVAIFDDTDLKVYPTPDKTVSLELTYYRLVFDMTSGSHLPEINARYAHYLIWLAFFYGMAFLEKEDVNKVVMWERKYEKVMKKLKRIVLKSENTSMTIDSPATGMEHASRIY